MTFSSTDNFNNFISFQMIYSLFRFSIGPKSGIKAHSDKNNFIITCHLALDVPEGECWIKVGDTKYHWKNGKAVVFDTSVIHSTENSSEKERYVLLIRFWHPELTLPEQKAFKLVKA